MQFSIDVNLQQTHMSTNKALEATLQFLLDFRVDEDSELHIELAEFILSNNLNLASELQEKRGEA